MRTPYDKQATGGTTPLGGQHVAKIGQGGTRSSRVHTRRGTQVHLWLLCVALWETRQCRDDLIVPDMNLCHTLTPSHSEHLCKSVNPHRHDATGANTRKYRNRTKRAEHSNPKPKQITIMAINTTSLRRHWPTLAREDDITHWACTEARMLKKDQLWFSERYTKEDKTNDVLYLKTASFLGPF